MLFYRNDYSSQSLEADGLWLCGAV